MKFIFKLISIIISISAAVLLLALLINDTFIKTEFKIEGMNANGITIPRFLYLVNNNPNNLTYHFYTFLPQKNLIQAKDNYLKNLDNCYGIYYYDKDNNITISKYSIVNNILKEVFIGIDYTNYCSERYVLSDTWLEDYKNTGKIYDLNITLSNLANLMSTLTQAKRNINPTVNLNYKSEFSITYNYFQKNIHYYMEIKDASEDEILVIKTVNEDKSFAIYEMPQAKEYLKSLL